MTLEIQNSNENPSVTSEESSDESDNEYATEFTEDLIMNQDSMNSMESDLYPAEYRPIPQRRPF